MIFWEDPLREEFVEISSEFFSTAMSLSWQLPSPCFVLKFTALLPPNSFNVSITGGTGARPLLYILCKILVCALVGRQGENKSVFSSLDY